jgi:hypothetical protein
MIQKNWQELIKPNKVEFSSKGKTQTTLVAEPLERGYGLTLGNALRRVLLSSLRGAAVTAVQIDGVLHEFSSIAGVREDVTDIVLNIKEIAIKMEGDGPKRMVVRKQGPGAVTAGDIQTVGDVEILNPDHVICTLDEGAEIRMEFTVDTGKGYVPAERNRADDAPIGLIPVDSLYSPVKKVSYKVENTRHGEELDKDKLTMTIETNGSITGEDAVALPPASCRTSSACSSTSTSRRRKLRQKPHRSLVQPGAAQEGRRTGAVGAFGQLPEERQHRLHWRPDPEDRSRDAAHPELRPQVAERDQGSAGRHGPASRHGSAGLAAGEHRRPRQALRRPVLSSE